jgi:putative DNA primase/helicase
VHAALVLVQHWMAEGRPLGTTRIGSFEDWSAVMGGILGTAEILGFLENLDELYASADVEGEAWRSLVAAWHATHGEKEVSASVLFDLAMEINGIDVGHGSDRSQRVTFGTALANQRDRVFSIPDAGNLQVTPTRRIRHAQQYRLRDVSTLHTQQAFGEHA